MEITTISIIGIVSALAAGWTIGRLLTATATETFRLQVAPVFRRIIPVSAALALAGGLSVGAWQASEDVLRELDLEPTELSDCSSKTSCSPCGACPME